MKTMIIMLMVLLGLNSNVGIGHEVKNQMYENDKVWLYLIMECTDEDEDRILSVYMIGENGEHENRAIVKNLNTYTGEIDTYVSYVSEDVFDTNVETLINNMKKYSDDSIEENIDIWCHVTF